MGETAQTHGVAGRWIGRALRASAAVVVGASAIVATAPGASAQGPSLSKAAANALAPLPAQSRFRVAAYRGVQSQGVTNLQIPTWTHTQAYPAGNAFSYTMVGTDPFTAQANPSVTIPSPVIGLKLLFADGTSNDASAADPTCTPSQSPVAATLNSPIFQTAPTLGTQFGDAYQRANFDPQTSVSGTNPNYHVLLQGSQAPPLTLTVPAAKGRHVAATCNTSSTGEGLVDIAWLQSQLESALGGMSGATSEFPVFELYNTVGCADPSNLSTCGILGMHVATTTSPVQTYAFADYQLAQLGALNPLDVEALGHEVAEWMADPLGDNLAPTWGYIGQFSAAGLPGCSPLLEVADPLTGNDHTVSIGAATYHVPDLAFASWFFRQSPSPTPGGHYSLFGGLTSPSDATVCPAQPVSVTATAGDGQATVSWQQPSGPGSSVQQFAVCYTTQLESSPFDCAQTGTFVSQEIDAPTTTTVVAGLTDGTPYAITVLAGHQLASGQFDLSTPSFYSNVVTPMATTATTSPPVTTAPAQPNTITTAVPTARLTSAAATPSSSATQLAFTGKADTTLIVMAALLMLLGGIVSWKWRRQRVLFVVGRDDILPARTWRQRAAANWWLPGDITSGDP